jgi:putative ABC transport system ATP-binding protein
VILQAENICKEFRQAGAAIEILRGVSFSLAKGETLAVVGQSGSGKSTLLSLLAGLDRPTAGSIVIDGQALGNLDEAQLAVFRAQRIGIVFQQFHLMAHLDALENVSLPLEIRRDLQAREKAALLLEKVGLTHRRSHLPAQLSGGECQRVAIARALAIEPALLLADEPSGNLDTRTGLEVMGLLFELVAARHTTLILVTHNEGLAARCRRRATLELGRMTG